jgi:hypothetical protein
MLAQAELAAAAQVQGGDVALKLTRFGLLILALEDQHQALYAEKRLGVVVRKGRFVQGQSQPVMLLGTRQIALIMIDIAQGTQFVHEIGLSASIGHKNRLSAIEARSSV